MKGPGVTVRFREVNMTKDQYDMYKADEERRQEEFSFWRHFEDEAEAIEKRLDMGVTTLLWQRPNKAMPKQDQKVLVLIKWFGNFIGIYTGMFKGNHWVFDYDSKPVEKGEVIAWSFLNELN